MFQFNCHSFSLFFSPHSYLNNGDDAEADRINPLKMVLVERTQEWTKINKKIMEAM